MPIRAYVWLSSSDDDGDKCQGHASLELSDGTYISWWPKEPIKPWSLEPLQNVAPMIGRTLSDDVRDENRQPSGTFILPDELGLNESNIKEWWAKMQEDGKWSLLGNNCCAAVKQALAAGGIIVEKKFPVEKPKVMLEYLEYLVDTVSYKGTRTKKTY